MCLFLFTVFAAPNFPRATDILVDGEGEGTNVILMGLGQASQFNSKLTDT